MPTITTPCLFCSSEVASLIGCSRDRVVYLAETRGIEPVKRVGLYRLWTDAQVEVFRKEHAIDRRLCAG